MADYEIHPSPELRDLFAQRDIPIQGQSIERATVVFLGLDANYSADLLRFFSFSIAYWSTTGTA